MYKMRTRGELIIDGGITIDIIAINTQRKSGPLRLSIYSFRCDMLKRDDRHLIIEHDMHEFSISITSSYRESTLSQLMLYISWFLYGASRSIRQAEAS